MSTSSHTPTTLTAAQQAQLLLTGAVEGLPAGQLEQRLAEGRPLRIKLGMDPTAPDIHLGHVVVLDKLREFQQLGHEVILIVGDFTARVGDPSGRSKTRPPLSPEQIDAAAATYAEQAFRILDPARTILMRNSQWLDMNMVELFELCRTTTVAQLLERDDFAKRMNAQQPVSVLELLYPLIQGFDSVAVKADVELGGTDQTFNLLLARNIQRHYGLREQICLTMPLLVGLDGHEKMSKSLGNYIGVSEPPQEIFGKTMSIPDHLLDEWERLLLHQQPGTTPPYERKRQLAARLTDRFHGPGAGEEAARAFDAVFKEHRIPDAIPELSLPADADIHLPALLADAFGVSRGQARRDIIGSAVRLDGAKVSELDLPRTQLAGKVLQLGKRRFCRLKG